MSTPEQPSAPLSSPTPTNDSHPTPPSPQRKQGNQRTLIAALLVVIAVLVLIVAVLLNMRTAPMSAQTTEATASPSTPAASVSAPNTPSATSASPTAAPSITDAKTLELVRTQAKRDPADTQAIGALNAPVVMSLYSDFSCPYCILFARTVEPELKDLVEAGTLRIEWHDLAQITKTSPLAAQAGVAAGHQGKFWDFMTTTYAATTPKDHPEYTEESLVQLARQAGVPDLERFRADMTDPATVAQVQKSKQDAYKLGITGTPFMFIGDAAIPGFKDAAYVRATVLDQAARAAQR